VLACSDPFANNSLGEREIQREELIGTAPPHLLEAFNRVLNDDLWLSPDEDNQLPLSIFEPFYRKEKVAGKDYFRCLLFDQVDPSASCSISTSQSTHAKNHAKVHFDYMVYACAEW
jgi:hypothetical protein